MGNVFFWQLTGEGGRRERKILAKMVETTILSMIWWTGLNSGPEGGKPKYRTVLLRRSVKFSAWTCCSVFWGYSVAEEVSVLSSAWVAFLL